jgi:pyroglutamyl-peptidase
VTLTVLLTGFGPFPGAPVNPTAALVRRLTRRRAAGARVQRVSHVFPTRYDAVDEQLPGLLARHRPDALVMFGLAARRHHLSIETLARNRVSMWFADAGGRTALGAAISAGTVAQMRGRAPMRRLVAAASRARVDARLSRDAGRYVCNYVYWRALEAAERPGGPRLAVFVHVPKPRPDHRRRDPARAGRHRAYALPDLIRAGEAIVAAVIAAARAPR